MNIRARHPAGLALVAGLAASPTLASPAVRYHPTDLGTLTGPPQALGISDAGVIVGFAPAADANFRAVRFDAGPINLGPLPPQTQSVALGAGPDGALVGAFTLGGLDYSGAIIGSSIVPLGAVLPRAVNASGAVAGLVRQSTADSLIFDRACSVASGSITLLPTLGGYASAALGINDAGWVVGSAFTAANDRPHATLWRAGAALDLGALGTPVGQAPASQAAAVNAPGTIVGWSSTLTGDRHACRWITTAGGAPVSRSDLGVLVAGATSSALAINAAEDIVGTSADHAVLWSQGQVLDLSSLLDTPGWDLRVASGVNAQGQIVGWGVHEGHPAAFLLTPVTFCLADVTGLGGPPAAPDSQLTVDDIIAFVNAFADGSGCPGVAPCSLSDLTSIGGPPGGPDGQLTVDDLIAFFNAFSDGC